MSANWGNPTTSSLYADFVAQVKERDEDLARAFDPAVTTPTNYPTGTVRWTSAAKRWEKWDGSAWVVLETSYAINISGNATNITGIAAPANGGTGLSSYTVGDLLFASGATTLSKLADIAVGNVLLSGGVGAAPSYGKVGLATHVAGTLPVANGGTGVATLTGVAFGNGTGAFSAATAAQLVAAIGTTPVARATSADNGGITAFGGATGAITLGAGLTMAGQSLSCTVTAPVTSVFGRTGAVTLGSGDVTGALGYTPANATHNHDALYAPRTAFTAVTESTVTIHPNVYGVLIFTRANGSTVTVYKDQL